MHEEDGRDDREKITGGRVDVDGKPWQEAQVPREADNSTQLADAGSRQALLAVIARCGAASGTLIGALRALTATAPIPLFAD
jgi:hypothetical protein